MLTCRLRKRLWKAWNYAAGSFQNFGKSKCVKDCHGVCIFSNFQDIIRFYTTFYNLSCYRSNEFKEDDAIWKGGEDGGVGGSGPPPAGMGAAGPTGGYVAK